ncbi:MAG: Carboxypeptidase [Flavipsychrobacter sp.]|nr:Carboxypeptidase [Flavipsychrobacter sp.]
MKQLLLLLAMALFITSVSAQKPEHYSRAKIYLDANAHTINDLSAQGIAVDHGEYKKNTFFISDFSETELSRVKKAGFKVDVIIADVVKHYQEQNKKKAEKSTAVSCDFTPDVDVPAHFHLGSYSGGYFSYTELMDILDSMQLLYPGIISVRQPIGSFLSIEGRPIYWIRISNNPGVDQPTKPQMLYTALHHAREPGSISATVFYLWYLLEHYATDNHIKEIIDNTELYFVPCVNPDGYLYNITTYPGGGGLWRKNRRNNLDGQYGVDLNRNYGYFWGYDNIGSSFMTSSDVYRGTAGFSEPETQAIKWFAENHNFKINLNYHSYHNDILYPWGYIPDFQTVDSDVYSNVNQFLTKENHYRYGTCNQVLNYIANGGSDDWMYGDTAFKHKVYAMTPEIGSNTDGFYPPTAHIIPDCKNNLPANIKAASLLLPFASIEHTDKKILTASSGYLHFKVQRLGFPEGATYKAVAIPLDSWTGIAGSAKTYTGLTPMQQIEDSFSYFMLPSTPNGQLVSYLLMLNNGIYDIYDTVRFYYGKEYNITTPSTNTLTDWNNSGWGLSTGTYLTPPAAIQSSATGADNYPDNSTISISTIKPADLTLSTHAYLNFYAKWAVETNYDEVTVSAAPAGTGIWQPLCGRYTRPSASTFKTMYDGQQSPWVQEEIDLGDYLGKKIDIQFELNSDNAGNYAGFYFDDVSITSVQDTAGVLNASAINHGSPYMSIYPNPVHETLTIAIPGQSINHPDNVVLYDFAGRTVMSIPIDKPVVSVDVSKLAAGIYYVKAAGNNTVFPVQKVVIER